MADQDPVPTAAAGAAAPAPAAPATEPKDNPAVTNAGESATPKATAPKAKTAGKAGAKRDGNNPAQTATTSADGAPKENLSLDPNDVEKPKIVKAKGSKNIIFGVVHVYSTFNNTAVTVTDPAGNVIGWSSAGKVGFKGSRKSTAYAAQMAAQDACRQAMGHGLREVEVRVKGPGAGRESAVRACQAIGLEVTTIRDVTPVPHNGCRPPKQRRV